MKTGDLYKIKTNKGWGLVQLIKIPKDKTQLQLIRVFYDLHDILPLNLQEETEKKHFFLEFPLISALRKRILIFVENVPISDSFSFPRYFRAENVFGPGWRIIDINGGQKVVEQLSSEEKKLSPWGTWNDTLLIDKLENGWRLENR